jgi:hypothetical protein
MPLFFLYLIPIQFWSGGWNLLWLDVGSEGTVTELRSRTFFLCLFSQCSSYRCQTDARFNSDSVAPTEERTPHYLDVNRFKSCCESRYRATVGQIVLQSYPITIYWEVHLRSDDGRYLCKLNEFAGVCIAYSDSRGLFYFITAPNFKKSSSRFKPKCLVLAIKGVFSRFESPHHLPLIFSRTPGVKGCCCFLLM